MAARKKVEEAAPFIRIAFSEEDLRRLIARLEQDGKPWDDPIYHRVMMRLSAHVMMRQQAQQRKGKR